MTFPNTLAEWVAIISNPLTAAFAIFMIFRVLNRPDGPTIPLLKKRLSIAGWTDPSKIAFAFGLTLLWSVGVAALGKELVNYSPDTWPLILARAAGMWLGNQVTYALIAKVFGPIGSKILSGTADAGELITAGLNSTPEARAAG